MARTYKRDGNGRFAGGGGGSSGGSKRPAAKPVSRGVNRLTRDNAGKITSVGGEGATARGGRLKTAAGNKRAMQTAKVSGGSPAGTIKGKVKRDPGAMSKVGQSKAAAPKTPATQKERWAARAKMLNNAAANNDAKAKRLRDANDTTGNTAFNTQPGKIPGRARMNAASERSFRMNEKAEQQRSRAANLERMATTNKGDAAKGRAARAEQVKASYGGIKKGQTIQSEHGEATVIKANAKTVTYQTKDGSKFTNRPYEFQKPKPATQGSSKVVDSAKVNRMAGRLGAKARAPKSSSPVKNANTVATRARAVAFLKGKGGTFPNAAAASEAMAANIRNRQVFSTGKKAAPKPAATKAASKSTARPLSQRETQNLGLAKSNLAISKERLAFAREAKAKAKGPLEKLKATDRINEHQTNIRGLNKKITAINARPAPGRPITGADRSGNRKQLSAPRKSGAIKGSIKRDASASSKLKNKSGLNAGKFKNIYMANANKAAAAKRKRKP